MANYFYIMLIKLNVNFWNSWIRKFNVIADLRRADFKGGDLKTADFHEALLHQASFYRASLFRADFHGSILHSADLSESDLRQADFQSVILFQTNFYRSNLDGADFRRANLSESGLSEDDSYLMAEDNFPFLYRVILNRDDNSDLRLANARKFVDRVTELRRVKLSSTNFTDASLFRVNFYRSNLQKAVFKGASLVEANLDRANLRQSNFCEANLSGVTLREAEICGANLSGADFSGADLRSSNLHMCELSAALLTAADFESANLSRANLNGSIFRGANLKGANLTGVQALNTSFESAVLTGACIEDWNINSETILQNIVCEYVYLKYDSQRQEYIERRPHDPDKIFADGDFSKLIQQAQSTVDLIFRDGINWEAFAHSTQQLQVEAGAVDLHIQSIENKKDGDFVIRVNTPQGLDKSEIQRFLEHEYKKSLQAIEDQYRNQLQARDDQISLYREQSANLWEIAKLAAKQLPINLEGTFILGNQYNMENAKFGGGFAAEGGTQIGGSFQESSVSIGRDATGSVLQSGDKNTTSMQFRQAVLPQEEEVDIRAELEALSKLLVSLQAPDQRKIENALEDVTEELSKSEPDKDELGQALDRAVNYAQKAERFASTIDKLRPHMEKSVAWLGKNWYKLLSAVCLTV